MTAVFTRPLHRVRVELELTAPVRFSFNHGPVLRGLLSQALGVHDLDGYLPFACQSGHVQFAAGDRYAFAVTKVGVASTPDASAQPSSHDDLLSALTAGLADVGRRPRTPDAATLAGNFTVTRVQRLPPPDFSQELVALGARSEITLRFVSPVRLARRREDQRAAHAYADETWFPPTLLLDRVFRRVVKLETGNYPTHEEAAAFVGQTESLTTAAVRGQWLDIPVRGSARHHRKGFTLGGFAGTVTLHGVAERHLGHLVVGQHLHVGESVQYGLGRYVVAADGVSHSEYCRPSTTIASRICTATALQRALASVEAGSDAAGVDGETPAVLHNDAELERVAATASQAAYQPRPLLGFFQRKPNGQLRALAVPAVRDRVLQRAAHDVLTPSVDTLLEECSFAYRRGLSRATAARAIEQAWDDGFRFVLDADIDAFFDSVPWDRLFALLHALWPFDPVVELLKAWVRAPVMFDGRVVSRRIGLPQGSAVAPLLANLYLDRFDEILVAQGFKLVRYADDFVVLAKTETDAQRARVLAAEALADLGLVLHPTKTDIVPLDAGFSYLGYLFCRSLSVDSPSSPAEVPDRLSADMVPATSWLAQVPLERLQALAEPPRAAGARTDRVPLRPLAEREDVRQVLYLTGARTEVRLQSDALHMRRDGQAAVRLPLRAVGHVVTLGRVKLTLPAAVELAERGVPVFLCERGGDVRAVVDPMTPAWDLWLAQARAGEDPKLRSGVARAIVVAKIQNSVATLRRFKLIGGPEARALGELCNRATDATKVDELMGIEGAAAAEYFRIVASSLDVVWDFHGRRKRPPPDPVNAMLSFGYSLLYRHASTALITQGLNPRLGLLHRPHGAHHALASDLMEEFRFLVDRFVLATVSRREAAPADFDRTAERGQCHLSRDLRKQFIERLERRLLTEVSQSGRGSRSYRSWMDHQARTLRAVISGKAREYRPFLAESSSQGELAQSASLD